MTRLAIVATCLSALLSGPAQGGIAWSDCGPAGGQFDRRFACDSALGEHVAVISMRVPRDWKAVHTVWVVLTIESAAPVLPDWWRFDICRPDGIAVRADFGDPPYEAGICEDPWLGLEPQITTTFATDGDPRRATISIRVQVDPAVAPDLAAGRSYNVCTLHIRSTDSRQEGACAGCEEAACLLLDGISVAHSGGVDTADTEAPYYAAWQGGQIFTEGVGCGKRHWGAGNSPDR